MKNKIFTYIAIAAVICSMLVLPSFAKEGVIKDESVYANLSNSGEVLGVYVVNSFELSESSVITDYGSYEKVINLTGSQTLVREGDKITFQAEKGVFHYQGNPKSYDLPWSFDLSYRLDGEEIPPSRLAGKSGKLETVISVKRNEKADPVFYKSFTVQITVSLDGELCTQINAPGATIITNGGNKQLSYTVLPGTEKEFAFSASVTDFEMEPITIACIRSEIDLDLDSIDMSGFTEDLSKLEDGIAQLDDGINEIKQGLGDLNGGLSEYAAGIEEFGGGISSLYDGASSLSTGISELQAGLSELSGKGSELVFGAKAMLDAAFDAANSSLSEVFGSFGIEAPVLTPETYESVLNGIITAYPQAKDDLEGLRAQLDAAAGFYNGIVEYTQGVSSAYDGIKSLGQGASMLKDGLYELSGSSASLSEGAGELSLGLYSLSGGFNELVSGSGRLRAETAGIEEKAKNQIALFVDDFSKKYSGEFKPLSYASDRNTGIRSVQFVFKTQGIKPEKLVAEAPVKAEKLNLWQRLLKLFGIYK